MIDSGPVPRCDQQVACRGGQRPIAGRHLLRTLGGDCARSAGSTVLYPIPLAGVLPNCPAPLIPTVSPRGMRVSSTDIARQRVQVRRERARELVDVIVDHLLRRLGGRRLRELHDELADGAAAPDVEDRDDCRR